MNIKLLLVLKFWFIMEFSLPHNLLHLLLLKLACEEIGDYIATIDLGLLYKFFFESK